MGKIQSRIFHPVSACIQKIQIQRPGVVHLSDGFSSTGTFIFLHPLQKNVQAARPVELGDLIPESRGSGRTIHRIRFVFR
jgi:hypothetical protein